MKILFSFIVIMCNSCAHAMGRANTQCQAPEIPARPQYETCIANDVGGGGCYDPRTNPSQYNRPSIVNYVCFKANEYQQNEEWVKFIIDSCKR